MILHNVELYIEQSASLEQVLPSHRYASRDGLPVIQRLAKRRERLDFTTGPVSSFWASYLLGEGDSALNVEAEQWTDKGIELGGTPSLVIIPTIHELEEFTVTYTYQGDFYCVTNGHAWMNGAPVATPDHVEVVSATLTVVSGVSNLRYWPSSLPASAGPLFGVGLPYVPSPYVHVTGLLNGIGTAELTGESIVYRDNQYLSILSGNVEVEP